MIINIDTSKQNKITDYGFQVNPPTPHNLYFRIHDKDYVIDHDNLTSLRLNVTQDLTGTMSTYILDHNDVVTYKGERLVKWTIPIEHVINLDKLRIVATVIHNGFHVLREFRLIIYKDNSVGMNAILTLIKSFNDIHNEYLKSIKRFEIGQPNGLIPLNSEGKIENSFMQPQWLNHITDTLYDTLYNLPHIHGLKIDKVTYDLLYYHGIDDEWYVANSIHGGQFGYPHRPSEYDIFGGNFGDELGNTYDGGSFNLSPSRANDGGNFISNSNEAWDAGLFTDTLPPIIGGGFTDKKDAIHGGGFD